MPKHLATDATQIDMNKWVNDTLTYIEGAEAIKKKNDKGIEIKNNNKRSADTKKAAKKAKQKLKREENKILLELCELREQFHSIYFKEFEAKNELKDFKNNKKHDKKKVLGMETMIKKLKKTKSKIEMSILELIGSLKTINTSFKFSYLPSKEEQQHHIQKCISEKAQNVNPQNNKSFDSPPNTLIPILANTLPSNLTIPISITGQFGTSNINPSLFAPPGFAPMYSANPNFFTNPMFNTVSENELEKNKDLSERIVTIRRVYLPDNEAQVTVTAKGESPDQDKLLYTFVNGQLVPAKKLISNINIKQSKKTTNKNDTLVHQIENSRSCQQTNNQDISKKGIGLQPINFQKGKHSKREEDIVLQQTIANKKNNKNKAKQNSYNCETDHQSSVIFPETLKTVKTSEQNEFKAKKKNKKKKKMQLEISEGNEYSINPTSKTRKSCTNNKTEPIKLNFGESDVLSFGKVHGNDKIKPHNRSLNNNEKQETYKQQRTYNDQSDKNLSQHKVKNNLEDLYPALRNLTLNSSSNDLSNSYHKSESPSIMEQLKQGINVENLKLPPGISLTKVDPATSQALKAKQNAIQKLSQSIIDIKQQNQSPSHQTYAPIYPNIEITPHFMHHDPSGLIMIDTNRSSLYQNHQHPVQDSCATNDEAKGNSAYQTLQNSKNLSLEPSGKIKRKNRKSKIKSNLCENQNKIITLKNPMFEDQLQAKRTSALMHAPGVDDQPAQITKNENGMFTIRNTALQENFLARYPYAGPGGILLPANVPEVMPQKLHTISRSGSNCVTNNSYQHGLSFQASMKDHVCEPNGY